MDLLALVPTWHMPYSIKTSSYLAQSSYFRNNFESLWNELKIKIPRFNPIDGAYICNFIKNLDGKTGFFYS